MKCKIIVLFDKKIECVFIGMYLSSLTPRSMIALRVPTLITVKDNRVFSHQIYTRDEHVECNHCQQLPEYHHVEVDAVLKICIQLAAQTSSTTCS